MDKEKTLKIMRATRNRILCKYQSSCKECVDKFYPVNTPCTNFRKIYGESIFDYDAFINFINKMCEDGIKWISR